MEHDPRSSFRPAPTAKAVASVLMCVGVGCSLLVDADRPQCTTDAECVARGFGDAICIEALCQSAPLSLPEEAGARERPSELPRDILIIARDAGDDERPAPDPTEAGVPVLDAGDPEWACLENFEPPSVAAGSLVSYRLRFERGGASQRAPRRAHAAAVSQR
jgi:hypothetical protein